MKKVQLVKQCIDAGKRSLAQFCEEVSQKKNTFIR